jgi:ProP effector
MTETDKPNPRRNSLLETLVSNYVVFAECRPLALGVHKVIQERSPDLSKDQIRKALMLHTGSTRYLKMLSQSEARFDLDGNPAGTVTEEQREVAMTALKERFRKAAERRKAEEQAKKQQEKLLQLAEKFNTR